MFNTPMKYQVSLMSWPPGIVQGIKQVIIPYQTGIDCLAARRQYADANGFTFLAERSDGLIALYWNDANRLIRLAIEPV
jgi:hypothetical protein